MRKKKKGSFPCKPKVFRQRYLVWSSPLCFSINIINDDPSTQLHLLV
jgi:hypothetical protein